MEQMILGAKQQGDTLGGAVRTHVRGCPIGLGEPCFDKIEALLAHGMMSLPATKAFEMGLGFEGLSLPGSAHNDAWSAPEHSEKDWQTLTQNAGGTLAGISNGMPIDFRVGFKAVSSHQKPQKLASKEGFELKEQAISGRHDPCVLPRAPILVEAMTWLVLADCFLRDRTTRL